MGRNKKGNNEMRGLTGSEMAECVRGATGVHEQEGSRFRCVRFDPPSLDYYRGLSEAMFDRAVCTAGIVLAFQTDSDRLGVRLELDVQVRPRNFVDIYVDGIFAAAPGSPEPVDRIEDDVSLPGLAGSVREVEIHLPHCRRGTVCAIEIDDGAGFAPAPETPVLLALGDSITQGMNAAHPSLIYPAVMARGLGMTLFNQGVGGHKFDAAGLVSRPVENPALITVAYGINDWNNGAPCANAGPWLARLRELYPLTPVAVFEPIWSSREGMDVAPKKNDQGVTLAEYRRELAEIAAGFPNMVAAPMAELLPPVEEFLSDGVHPSQDGHFVYGTNAARLLLG